MHEPWVLFRKPVEGTVRENLRKWNTGALRRPNTEQPFGDVIPSGIARGWERKVASHPSLKPQAFLRRGRLRDSSPRHRHGVGHVRRVGLNSGRRRGSRVPERRSRGGPDLHATRPGGNSGTRCLRSTEREPAGARHDVERGARPPVRNVDNVRPAGFGGANFQRGSRLPTRLFLLRVERLADTALEALRGHD